MSAVLFQTMPPLSPDEYRQLEASCLAHGIQVPIIVDESGTVIDGHHRQKIAQEHGLYLPTETRDTLTDAEKTTLSISLNIDRRQLDREQRRAIIAASLRSNPNLSDRGHAARTGASHPTVASVRREIAQVESFTTSFPAMSAEDIQREMVDAGTLDPDTGEIKHIEPTVTEHTFTEKVKTVTGLDGKTYTRPELKPVQPARDFSALSDAQKNFENAKQAAMNIGRGLESLLGFRSPQRRDLILTDWWPLAKNEVPPSQSDLFNPEPLREIAAALNQLANEMEAHRV